MPKRIAANTTNASTIDILNVIRENASYEYQQQVPKVEKATDIPKVGEVLYGTPALANQFVNALVNRIALVRVQSATFNNPYAILKKGYLQFGETVEEIFVNIAKVVQYNAEKAESREFKRTLPDVRSAFHVMNWVTMYPVTIQDEDLKQAFLSMDGVQNLIAKIIDSVYTAAEYDEFLLFKYLLIKSLSHGKAYNQSIGVDDNEQAAINFRGMSNLLPFLKPHYNEVGVLNNTPKGRQVIFMDAMYNAQFDVKVLAGAFNMDKADFMGRLFLIDDWTTFDNKRFEEIRAESDGLEEVTAEELALLQDVKAVLVDEEWFQVYDNLNKFTETYVSSGLYWNYFYHVRKTFSHSPFANIVAFINAAAAPALPASVEVEIVGKDTTKEATVFTLKSDVDAASLTPNNFNFEQTEDLAGKLIAVQRYGAVMIPASATAGEITLVGTLNGTTYTATTTITSASSVGDKVTLNKAAAPAARAMGKK